MCSKNTYEILKGGVAVNFRFLLRALIFGDLGQLMEDCGHIHLRKVFTMQLDNLKQPFSSALVCRPDDLFVNLIGDVHMLLCSGKGQRLLPLRSSRACLLLAHIKQGCSQSQKQQCSLLACSMGPYSLQSDKRLGEATQQQQGVSAPTLA